MDDELMLNDVTAEQPEEDAQENTKKEAVFRLLYDLSEGEKADILSEMLKRLTTSTGYMNTLYPQMIGNYKKYSSIAEQMTDDLGNPVKGRANLFIPYPYAVVESELPRLAGRLPRCRAFPRKEIEAAKVEAIQDLIYYTLDRMNFIELQCLWMRQHALYGWSPLFYYWRNEIREVLKRQTVNTLQGPTQTLVRGKETIWDDFYATVLDCFDVFLQPGVENIEDGDWFFFREWFSAKDLKKLVESGILYPEVAKYVEEAGERPKYSGSDDNGRKVRDELKGITSSISPYAYGKFELMWCLEDDRVVQILDRSVVARVGDNPHPLQVKPIINCNLTKLVNEPIGIGTVEALAGLPDKLNALSNARLDNIALTLNKVILANRFSQTDFKNIRMEAGNVILTDDVERSIKVLDIGDVTQSSEREIRSTKEDIQFVSAVSDYIAGTDTQSRLSDTATGVSTIVREANARFALKLAAFESGSLRKLIQAIHIYNMTYMPEQKRIHVLGPKGYMTKDITLEDIMCECEFIVEPGSSVPLDQLARREALVNLLDRVMKLTTVVDQNKYMKEVFEAHDIRNPDDILIAPPAQESQLEDSRLADAENTSLALGEQVELKGLDDLHMAIHSKPIQDGSVQKWSEQGRLMLQDHIQQHATHKQKMAMAAQQFVQGMQGGGQNGVPNQQGAGGEATGGQPQMGGLAQVFGGGQGTPPAGNPVG